MQTRDPGRTGRPADHDALSNLKQAHLAARPRAALEAVLSASSQILEEAVTATLNEAEQQLFKLADQAKSNEQQQRYFEARREIHRGRADITPRYLLRLESALATVGRSTSPDFARVTRQQRDDFALVDQGEFEESLALQEIAGKAEIRHSQALFAMGQRFGVLAGSKALEAEDLPVGPYRLCECFRGAVQALDLPLEHRVLVYRVFDRVALAQLSALYDRLNQLFVELRILPNLALSTRGRRVEPAANAGARGARTATPTPSATPADSDKSNAAPGATPPGTAPAPRTGFTPMPAGASRGPAGDTGAFPSSGGAPSFPGGQAFPSAQPPSGGAGSSMPAFPGMGSPGGAPGGAAPSFPSGQGMPGAAAFPSGGGMPTFPNLPTLAGLGGAPMSPGGASTPGAGTHGSPRGGMPAMPGLPSMPGVMGEPDAGGAGASRGGAPSYPNLPDVSDIPGAAGIGNPMTGWPTPPSAPADVGGADPRDMEVFETMRDLLAGRRNALGIGAPQPENAHEVRTDDVQSVLAALQGKPAPAMRIGGKTVPRSVTHLKQDLLNQLRQLTPEGKQPALEHVDNDTIDLVGMLFDHLLKDVKSTSPVQDFLTRLQIPLLRVALRDKSFFTRRSHPARQLLNSVAETGLFWFDDEGEDRALVEKMRLVVERVTSEYDDDIDVFEDLLGDLSKHLGTIAKKSEVAERRHVDAARGRERLDLARSTASSAIAQRLEKKNAPALMKTLLEQAWTDVLALTILRQGEQSDAYKRRLDVADQLLDTVDGVGKARVDDAAARSLKQEVEAGLSQVGYHVDDVQAVVKRLFGADKAAANDDPATLTELAIKLKAKSRLGSDTEATPDVGTAAKPAGKRELLVLNDEEKRVFERLRTVPFGTWFEFVTNQQGAVARRKLSWFSTVTGRCLFVNQRGARTDERTLDQLARDIVRGHAKVVEQQKEGVVDRALGAIMNTLRAFVGKAPAAKPA